MSNMEDWTKQAMDLDQHSDEIDELMDYSEDVAIELTHFLCVLPAAMMDLLRGDPKQLISGAARVIAESYFLGQREALEGLRGAVGDEDEPKL